MKRENAKMGVFITLAGPTRPMLVEATKEGFYEHAMGKFPKLQIVTVAEYSSRQTAANAHGSILKTSKRQRKKIQAGIGGILCSSSGK